MTARTPWVYTLANTINTGYTKLLFKLTLEQTSQLLCNNYVISIQNYTIQGTDGVWNDSHVSTIV